MYILKMTDKHEGKTVLKECIDWEDVRYKYGKVGKEYPTLFTFQVFKAEDVELPEDITREIKELKDKEDEIIEEAYRMVEEGDISFMEALEMVRKK